MADALPGLGIVAAVLGVVITMGALGGPPEEIGKKVAAALVGTFLGILLCYVSIGPLAANMSKGADEEHAYYYVLRVTMAAFMRGTPPTLAVEFGRRSIPATCAQPSRSWRITSRTAAMPPLRAVPKRRQLRPRHRDGGTRRSIQIAVSLQCRDSSRDRRRLCPR